MTKAYKDTEVSVDRSRASIGELLRKRGANAIAWIDQPGIGATLRFQWGRGDLVFTARFDLKIPIDEAAIRHLDRRRRQGGHPPLPRAEAVERVTEKDARRLHRVLFWHVKSIFEAEEAGLLTAEEAFLGWLEAPDGQCLKDKLIPQLGAQAGDLGRVLQLPAGRPDGVS